MIQKQWRSQDFFRWLTLNFEPVTFSLSSVLSGLLMINCDTTAIHLGDIKVKKQTQRWTGHTDVHRQQNCSMLPASGRGVND